MPRKNLMIMFASLFVLGVLLAPGLFSSTAHAHSKINSVANSPTNSCPTLRYHDGYDNSKTDRHYVAILQGNLFSWLKKHDSKFDYSNTTVIDGYFGPGTLSLVDEVQYKNFGDKGVDGIVGPQTWHVLNDCKTFGDVVLPPDLQ